MQRLGIQIDHVARRIIAELQVAAQLRLQHHVLEVALGRKEGRRHVIIAVQGQHAQMRIGAHRGRQVGGHVGNVLLAPFGRLVAPVPFEIAALPRAQAIGQVRLVADLARHLIQEAADIETGDPGARRVIFRFLARRVGIDAGIAAVEPPQRRMLVAQQFLAKTRQVDAQIRALEIIDRQAGIAVELARDLVRLLRRDVGSFQQRGGIGAIGELPRFLDKCLQAAGAAAGHLVMIPGGGGIAWQIADMDGVEARLADAVIHDR